MTDATSEPAPAQTFQYRGKNLRAAIRWARKVKGWNYAEVGRQSGQDLRAVMRLFQGAADSDMVTVEAIMRALGVKLRYRDLVSDDCLAVLVYSAGRRPKGWATACRYAGIDPSHGSALKHRKAVARLYLTQALMKALGVEAVF